MPTGSVARASALNLATSSHTYSFSKNRTAPAAVAPSIDSVRTRVPAGSPGRSRSSTARRTAPPGAGAPAAPRTARPARGRAHTRSTSRTARVPARRTCPGTVRQPAGTRLLRARPARGGRGGRRRPSGSSHQSTAAPPAGARLLPRRRAEDPRFLGFRRRAPPPDTRHTRKRERESHMDAGRQEPARAERDGDSGAHAGGTGAQEAQEVLHVPPGGGRLLNVLGSFAAIKVTGRETGGAYAVWEDTVPPGGRVAAAPRARARGGGLLRDRGRARDRPRAQPPCAPARAATCTRRREWRTPSRTPAHAMRACWSWRSPAGWRSSSLRWACRSTGSPSKTPRAGAGAPPPPEVLRRVLESASRHGITILSPPESH